MRWLELHVQVVNNLNVFPIPDGDTGTNMFLTLQSAVSASVQVSESHTGAVAEAMAYGALMGGRGNSGVILSQFFEGMAAGLADKAEFTAIDLAHAWRLGANQAYHSVVDPVEGTILTVARAAAEAAEQSSQMQPDLTVLLEAVVAAIRTTQADTPNMLAVLREAGVTDSGGQGLVYILEGGLRFMRNEAMDSPGQIPVASHGIDPADQQPDTYDVQFLIEGEGLAVDDIRAGVISMGESPLVVGSDQVVRVHIHGADPKVSLNFGAKFGTVRQVIVENMMRQSRHDIKPIGIVTVVSGLGFIEIFQRESVVLVQPVNKDELLSAVHQIQANQVLILPNDSDTILIAQDVQARSKKVVQVVPTRTMPQGIAALLAFNCEIGFVDNARRMSEAAQHVRTIEVLDNSLYGNGDETSSGGVTAFYEGKLLFTGQNLVGTTLDALRRVEAEQYELITIYLGQNSLQEQTQILKDEIQTRYPEAEVELYVGEQVRYQYIISLE